MDFIENIFEPQLPPNQYSALALAYLGDNVYELFIRSYLISKGNYPVHQLHKTARGYVSAAAQSEAVGWIEAEFTEEEEAVYKRGRNAKSATVPKNAKLIDYKRATGLETLIGYLYLNGQSERIFYFLKKIIEHH